MVSCVNKYSYHRGDDSYSNDYTSSTFWKFSYLVLKLLNKK